jgi:calcineurin-like phosphoesterase family protein
MSAQLRSNTLSKVKTLREEQMAELNNALAVVINNHAKVMEPQDVLCVLGFLTRRMEKAFDSGKEI